MSIVRSPAALLIWLLCLAANVARADLVVVQKVEGSGLEGEMTIRFQGTKVRADLALPLSTIVDSATGETLVLQHKTKTFNRITAEQTKSLSEQLLKAQGATEPPNLTPIGEKKEVAGHQTHGFVWTVGQLKIKFWVCSDFPNADAIQQQLNLLQNSGLATVAASMMPTAAQMPGLRLRTEFELSGQKVSTTIVSIKESPVEAKIFEVPAGYKEVAVPVGGAGQNR